MICKNHSDLCVQIRRLRTHAVNDPTDAPIAELALAVLCGGESQRMGRSKATLDFAGEPMVVRMVRRLSRVCGGEHFVVAGFEQSLPPFAESVQILRDRAPGRGPLEGIVLATRAVNENSSNSAVAVVGCDLPFIQPFLMRSMFGAFNAESDVICVQDDSRMHPLIAIYRPRIQRVAESRRMAGLASLHGLLATVCVQPVGLEFVRAADPTLRSLVNVNTPDDYDSALQMPDE